MNRYQQYKDSGISWLGDIPDTWAMTTAKHVLTKLNRPTTFESPALICSNHGKVLLRGEKRIGLISETEHDYQGVEPGDLLIHGMDTWHGAIAMSELSGKCTSVVHVCSSSQNKRFIMYYLQGLAIRKVFKAITNGVRQNTSDFRSWNEAGKIPVVIPTTSEQQAIVDFLDQTTAKIDEYIAVKEVEIDKLGLLKQSIISEVVTRGLNPRVPMKDSGISWLGDVPAHWKRIRSKNLFTRMNRPVDLDDEVITCFRDGQVTLRRNRRTEGFTESFKEIGYQGIRPGDLVIHQMDAFAGAIGVSDSKGKGTPVYICLQPKEGIFNWYYAYLLREMARTGYIKSLYRGIRERSSDFRFETFSKLFLPVPPFEEQQAIVDFLDRKIQEIDKFIANIRLQIEKLKFYKQRLISDTVTGKIDVRTINSD